MTGFSLSVFLPDGNAGGLRIVTKSHWSGVAVMCPRTEYFSASKRGEFHQSGLYLLIGPATDGTGRDQVYVGEGDNVHKRITAHDLKKEFWTEVVIFTKTDNSLNKADVRYLEARLVEIAKELGVAALDNSTAPAPPKPTEAHQADLESFLQDIRTISTLLGINAFRNVAVTNRSSATGPQGETLASSMGASATGPQGETFTFSMGGMSGKMRVTDNSYILLAGPGIARANKKGLPSTYQALRNKMVEEKRLVLDPEEPDHLRLMADTPFRSPTAAAAVVYGGSMNGRIAWKNNKDKTLADLEAEAAQQS